MTVTYSGLKLTVLWVYNKKDISSCHLETVKRMSKTVKFLQTLRIDYVSFKHLDILSRRPGWTLSVIADSVFNLGSSKRSERVALK